MKNRLFVALILASIGGARPLPGQRLVEDPLTVFAKMMPVLSHDRCVNCHGATNPYTGDYHPGSVPRSSTCVGCHTARVGWRLPLAEMSFFKKTTRQLCDHFSVNLPVGEITAVHLETRRLDRSCLRGAPRKRGHARVHAEATHDARGIRARHRNWVQQTGGGCSAWEGTITRTETVAANDTGPGLATVGRSDQ